MTKSRMTLLLLVLAAPPAVAAPPRSADEAIAGYRETFQSTRELDCPRGVGSDDIVVCGRRTEVDPHRLPLPVEPTSGTPIRLVPGEAPRAAVAGCTMACPPAFGIGLTLKRGQKPALKGAGD